ncbi:MAG: hypothetical protein IPM54_17890 [Polyangiaceae bacterium]|nr:hypothetical protein [Polyangiaceae bacterium]
MRKDMFEIIIERPRLGWRAKGKGRYVTKRRTDPEALPCKEPMWFRGQTKSLNENLAPLRRFLGRRVGRPWNAVWSELREFLSPKSAVQKHVYDHVLQYVERNPVIIDGIPYHPTASGPNRDKFWPLSSYGWRGFYVCPRTGLLRLARDDHQRKARASKRK